MIHPLKNNVLNKKLNKLENEATDPVDNFPRSSFIYNSIFEICKHVDDAVANHIITFLNNLKYKHGC